jgi:intein/homing endonuclease
MSESFQEKIRGYLKAGYPALYIVSHEEARVIGEITTEAVHRERSVWTWELEEGWTVQSGRGGGNRVVEARTPSLALVEAKKAPPGTLLILKDFHIFLKMPEVYRKIKTSLNAFAGNKKAFIFISPIRQIPVELEKELTIVEMSLPDREQLKVVLDSVAEVTQDEIDPEISNDVVEAALGLTTIEAENTIALARIKNSKFDRSVVKVVQEEKAATIKKSGTLEWWPIEIDPNQLGGVLLLKDYIVESRVAFTPEAREFGIDGLKGILLIGPAGTGKSLSAKVTAATFEWPLFYLDMGKIFGSLVGQSEERARAACQLMEAVAPCVVLIDEIEKGFAGLSGSGQTDSGVSARVLGTFLTWLQEHTAPVYCVACVTAGTPVVLADGTVVPIEAVREGSTIPSLDLQEGKLVQRNTDLLVTPTAQKVVGVTTTTTKFIGTVDHPVYRVGRMGIEEVTLENLSVGTRIARPTSLPEPTTKLLDMIIPDQEDVREVEIMLPEVLTEEVAELLGFLCADGSFADRGRVRFNENHPQLFEHVRSECQKLFGVCSYHDIQNAESHLGYIDSSRLMRWFQLNFPEMVALKQERRVPAAIFRSPNSVVAAFLRGFADGDGTASKEGRVAIAGTNLLLLQDVRFLLHRLGIGFSRQDIITAKNRAGERITISGRNSLDIFEEVVGFSCDYKAQRLMGRVVHTMYAEDSLDICPIPFALIDEALKEEGLAASRLTYYKERRWSHSDTSRSILLGWIDVFSKRLGEDSRVVVELKKIAGLSWDKVTSVEIEEKETPVFDIRVPGTHTFLGAGVWMHNTCNSISSLPPELVDRFDECFFVDLPANQERQDICSIHLEKRGRNPKKFDLKKIGEHSDGYTGRDIEKVIKRSLIMALRNKREVETDDILFQLEQRVPTVQIKGDEIAEMRKWAKDRGVRMASDLNAPKISPKRTMELGGNPNLN